MRTDYFKDGPPWKFIFEDRLGFRHTLCANYKDPPETYEFSYDRIVEGGLKVKSRRKFRLVGKLGNTVAYKEV